MTQGRSKAYIARDETFDAFLAGQGPLAEAEELPLTDIIADRIREAMEANGLTRTAMAQRMRTERRQLDRLLDPRNLSVTLATLPRAASAVGRSLRVELVGRAPVRTGRAALPPYRLRGPFTVPAPGQAGAASSTR